MSDDLLAKEMEFHRLNRELQVKTLNVIKEVDSIIDTCTSNNSFSNSNRSHSDFVMKDIKMTCSEDVTLKIDIQSKALSTKIPEISSNENVSNNEIPLRRKNSKGNAAIINLLQGKIDTLYKELQVMQDEYKKKCNYSKELEVANKKLDDAQVKLHNQIGVLNDTIIKLENINSDILLNCQTMSSENIVLKKDLEDLKKKIKVLNQQSSNYDLRLNRSLDNNEKLKNALKCTQIEEKELRNQVRKLQEDKRSAIKHLEKQRSELVQIFKKQMLLINNLKKQNMFLVASGQIRFTEENFANLLEWKPQQF